MKKYIGSSKKASKVEEPAIAYARKSQNTFDFWLTTAIPDFEEHDGRLEDGAAMMKVIKMSRDGIPQNQFQALKDKLAFTTEDWMHILDASESTYRRLGKKDPLDKKESEKLADIALLGEYGENVFGSSDIFLDWLNTKSPALGHVSPKELLDTSHGIRMIRMELGRIDHGIPL